MNDGAVDPFPLICGWTTFHTKQPLKLGEVLRATVANYKKGGLQHIYTYIYKFHKCITLQLAPACPQTLFGPYFPGWFELFF